MINAKDPVDSVLAVIRGRLRKQEAIASSQGTVYTKPRNLLAPQARVYAIISHIVPLVFLTPTKKSMNFYTFIM